MKAAPSHYGLATTYENSHSKESEGVYGQSVAEWSGVFELLVLKLHGIQTAIMLVKARRHLGKKNRDTEGLG